MTISAWLKTLNPLAILYDDRTTEDFERRTNHRAEDWPAHRWEECKHQAKFVPAGVVDDLVVVYAYEIARHLCMENVGIDPYVERHKAKDVGKSGQKMDIWSRSIEMLERSGM